MRQVWLDARCHVYRSSMREFPILPGIFLHVRRHNSGFHCRLVSYLQQDLLTDCWCRPRPLDGFRMTNLWLEGGQMRQDHRNRWNTVRCIETHAENTWFSTFSAVAVVLLYLVCLVVLRERVCWWVLLGAAVRQVFLGRLSSAQEYETNVFHEITRKCPKRPTKNTHQLTCLALLSSAPLLRLP